MISNLPIPTSLLNEGGYDYPGDRFFFDFYRYTMPGAACSEPPPAPTREQVKIVQESNELLSMEANSTQFSTTSNQLDTTTKSTLGSKVSTGTDLTLIDELFPPLPLSPGPGHIVFNDNGLETKENLKRYYSVKRLAVR